MATYFYDLPSSSKRRNKYIYPTTTKLNSVGDLRIVNLMDVYQASEFPITSGSFIHPREYDTTCVSRTKTDMHKAASQRLNVSTIVVADLDSNDGLELVKAVLQSLVGHIRDVLLVRYSFTHGCVSTLR